MPAGMLNIGFEYRGRRFKDASKGLRSFYGKFRKDFETKAPQKLSKELRIMLDAVAQALIAQHSSPWPGGTTATSLSKRSGAGLKSIKNSVRVTGSTFNTIRGRIGASREMKIHEKGGVIKVKKAKFLTIPLKAALDSRGIPLKRSARDWRNTFVAKSKKGNLLIFQKRGVGIVPLYVLKKEVRIPPRLGMEKRIRAAIPFFVDRAMDRMVKTVMKK